jgi:hypothetical protein
LRAAAPRTLRATFRTCRPPPNTEVLDCARAGPFTSRAMALGGMAATPTEQARPPPLPCRCSCGRRVTSPRPGRATKVTLPRRGCPPAGLSTSMARSRCRRRAGAHLLPRSLPPLPPATIHLPQALPVHRSAPSRPWPATAGHRRTPAARALAFGGQARLRLLRSPPDPRAASKPGDARRRTEVRLLAPLGVSRPASRPRRLRKPAAQAEAWSTRSFPRRTLGARPALHPHRPLRRSAAPVPMQDTVAGPRLRLPASARLRLPEGRPQQPWPAAGPARPRLGRHPRAARAARWHLTPGTGLRRHRLKPTRMAARAATDRLQPATTRAAAGRLDARTRLCALDDSRDAPARLPSRSFRPPPTEVGVTLPVRVPLTSRSPGRNPARAQTGSCSTSGERLVFRAFLPSRVRCLQPAV